MELGVDLDIGQYVASGVVAFDLHRRTIKWSQVRGDEAPWARACWERDAACGVGSGWVRQADASPALASSLPTNSLPPICVRTTSNFPAAPGPVHRLHIFQGLRLLAPHAGRH